MGRKVTTAEQLARHEAKLDGVEASIRDLWAAVDDIRKCLAKTREQIMIIHGIGIAINAVLIFVGQKLFN